MKLSEVMRVLTPGELDAIKQAYRQGYDRRKKLHSMRPPVDTDDAAHYARIDAIADVSEEQFFAGLPQAVRYEGRGYAEAPKRTGRIDDP